MSDQEWYYQDDRKLHGPISAGSLKRRADRGEVTPEMLVRREGRTEWVQAKTLKGLFPSLPPEPEPQPLPVRPTRRAPERSPSPDLDWHPLDTLVASLRDSIPTELPQQISRGASLTGVLSLYLASFLVVLGGAVLTVRTNVPITFAYAAAAAAGLIVLQYVAQRLLTVMDSTITSNKSVLSSLAVPDCVFVLTLAITLGAAVSLTSVAISATMLTPALIALGTLVVGLFAALVAILPAGLGVVTKPDCRASEDAVGILTFLVKIMIRCTPIVFMATVLFGTYRVASSLIDFLSAEKTALALTGMTYGLTAIGILAAAAAVPFYAYAFMLLYHLSLDVISAIVSMPAKLDAIADVRRPVGDE